MRVVLVCGSLEPGHDGVGDHCRALAAGLRSEGHGACLLALNDRHVVHPVETQTTLRLPSAMSWEGRVELAAQFVDRASPDVMSLHFVPFAFHDKGIASGLARALRKISRCRPWHVMCHELWIGQGNPIRQQVLGLVQRRAIAQLLGELDPIVIHATIDSNLTMLKEIGRIGRKLPLFGNIPLSENVSRSSAMGTELRLAAFGTPPSAHQQTEILRQFGSLSTATRTVARVQIAGGDDVKRASFARNLATVLDRPGCVLDVGRLSEAEVHALFVWASVGLSRAGGHLMGKSGVSVSMLEHGLPVWAPSCQADPIDVPIRSDLVTPDLTVAMTMLRQTQHGLLPVVMERLLSDIREALQC